MEGIRQGQVINWEGRGKQRKLLTPPAGKSGHPQLQGIRKTIYIYLYIQISLHIYTHMHENVHIHRYILFYIFIITSLHYIDSTVHMQNIQRNADPPIKGPPSAPTNGRAAHPLDCSPTTHRYPPISIIQPLELIQPTLAAGGNNSYLFQIRGIPWSPQ